VKADVYRQNSAAWSDSSVISDRSSSLR